MSRPQAEAIMAIAAALAFLALSPAAASADPKRPFQPQPEPAVSVQPQALVNGGPGFALVEGIGPQAEAEGLFNGRKIWFFRVNKGLVGLFGADVALAPGTYPLTLAVADPDRPAPLEYSFALKVASKDYGVRELKVPKRQVDLSPADQARAAAEKTGVEAALALKTPDRLWSGRFVNPVSGRVNSSFGRRTKINGVMNPRPHAGADFAVPEGTPVKAAAAGRVVLAGDHFFAGKSVYVDHGQGLLSMYFHLSDIRTAAGEEVARGEPIALSGKTGRVTGAHLHFGLYLGGARLDPTAFQKLTERLEE
jgi:murein DD-endopeptidase MepM/ murein hydrolase activator NlpD